MRGKPAFYELMTIVEGNGSLALRLERFSPDMTAWEEKNRTVESPVITRRGSTNRFGGLAFQPASDALTVDLAISRQRRTYSRGDVPVCARDIRVGRGKAGIEERATALSHRHGLAACSRSGRAVAADLTNRRNLELRQLDAIRSHTGVAGRAGRTRGPGVTCLGFDLAGHFDALADHS